MLTLTDQTATGGDPGTHIGVCRGALGELYQGLSAHTNDEIAIVSSLIPKYSWAYFTPDNGPEAGNREVLLETPGRCKSFRALDIYCRLKRRAWPAGRWRFKSDLQVARGMASSTADIVATIRCAASYFRQPASTGDIIQVLSQIERSDSVFLDHPVLFCSSRHRVLREFEKVPPIYALYMHEADKVETEGTKGKLVDYYRQHKRHYLDLSRHMEQALRTKNIAEICSVSTMSSELSQEILPKQHFHAVYRAMQHCKADGVITAHTGSVIGLLFRRPPDIHCLASVGRLFNELGGHCQYTEIG
ncbi:hypothetical protein FKG94_21370 [Exilibacterium tricleocarpae]|uniref:GHMP kinase N-terminal domain-containing protein n=1 Tax=Exilibacterium tricleocarpae TaxID=2591008 RepID=A0A545T022_9GAMM|nr:hypothetical protein [Exilibacterium tricleocarpae]TQV70574.1 hypothetical protein FKG94_21370 [Exilibacterium tricleocarpae]